MGLTLVALAPTAVLMGIERRARVAGALNDLHDPHGPDGPRLTREPALEGAL